MEYVGDRYGIYIYAIDQDIVGMHDHLPCARNATGPVSMRMITQRPGYINDQITDSPGGIRIARCDVADDLLNIGDGRL